MDFKELEKIEKLWHKHHSCYHADVSGNRPCSGDLWLLDLTGSIHVIMCDSHFDRMRFDARNRYKIGILSKKDFFALTLLNKW